MTLIKKTGEVVKQNQGSLLSTGGGSILLYILYSLDKHLEELIDVVKAQTEASVALLKFITE